MEEREKYYIVNTPRPLKYTHYRLPLDVRRSMAWMDSSIVPGARNMECIWYYKPLEGPAQHVHDDTDEVLGFFGTNQDDPTKLGGVIEFEIEDETITITESCLLFFPKGTKHCPFHVTKVDTPIFHFSMTLDRYYAKAMAPADDAQAEEEKK